MDFYNYCPTTSAYLAYSLVLKVRTPKRWSPFGVSCGKRSTSTSTSDHDKLYFYYGQFFWMLENSSRTKSDHLKRFPSLSSDIPQTSLESDASQSTSWESLLTNSVPTIHGEGLAAQPSPMTVPCQAKEICFVQPIGSLRKTQAWQTTSALSQCRCYKNSPMRQQRPSRHMGTSDTRISALVTKVPASTTTCSAFATTEHGRTGTLRPSQRPNASKR
jgi:hypothetical protein